jgi:hypothetical protein
VQYPYKTKCHFVPATSVCDTEFTRLLKIEMDLISISTFSIYGPGVDSASNRNEYQVYFLGVKAAGA